MDFRHIAIEGPIAAGKCALTERLAVRLEAGVVLDDTENPFLADFYEGRAGAAFQAQLFSLLARHRQQVGLRQSDLDDNELFIYQRLYDLLAPDVVTPDLVIYLQTPTDLLRKRARAQGGDDGADAAPDDRYLGELNEAYNHFFFHYTATPLLVVEMSESDLGWGERALDDLLKQIESMGSRTRYYVPRTAF